MARRTTPTERRTFFELHEQGLSYREIAEVLTMPINTVKTLIHRARASLARTLPGTSQEV